MVLSRAVSSVKVKEAIDSFRPLFDVDEHEEGIPIETLKNYIEQKDLACFPPKAKNSIYKKYDVDKNGRISMGEFENLMLNERQYFDYSKLSKFKRLVFEATLIDVPNSKKTEYLDQYNCVPPPFTMLLISLAEVAVFVYQAVKLGYKGTAVGAMSGVDIDSRLIYNPYRRYEAWRFITYLFLHVGYTHLLFNLIFQLFVGIPLEMVHKWWRVLLIYMLGTLAGSLATSVCDPTTYLAGASGGAYAIATAHIANVIMNWEELQANWSKNVCRFLSSAPMRLTIIILVGLIDTGIALYSRYTTEGESSVGLASHMGGMLAGLFLGIPILRNLNEKRWERIVCKVSIAISVVLLLFGILWNIFAHEYFLATDWSPLDHSF